ncbi:MAG TPA: hypothetical protein VFG68_19675 [Fimbriiglobus sp.]|nr:hypothetical protein [Fimbriiglobus sp.]
MSARLLLIAGFVGLAGCGSKSGPPAPNMPTVEIVVPKGFTGPVWVIQDASAPDLLTADKSCQVKVPAGGVVKTRSIQTLENQHHLTAKFEDGTPLPLSNEVDDATVALRGGDPGAIRRGRQQVSYVVYYVGVEQPAGLFLTGDTTPKAGK